MEISPPSTPSSEAATISPNSANSSPSPISVEPTPHAPSCEPSHNAPSSPIFDGQSERTLWHNGVTVDCRGDLRTDDDFLLSTSFLPPPNEVVGIISSNPNVESLTTVALALGIGDRLSELSRHSITAENIHDAGRLLSLKEIVPEDSIRCALLERVVGVSVDLSFDSERQRLLAKGSTESISSGGERLGQGATGCIRVGGGGYVVKSSRDPTQERTMLREALVAERFGGRGYGVVCSFGCVEIDGQLNLVMRQYDRGPLSDWLFGSERLTKKEKLGVLWWISRGLLSIHSKGFAHCDLKPENILRWGASDVRIADFGLTVRWEFCVSGVSPRGTPGYMPPSFAGDPRKIDVYSFAIIAWEVWTQRRAFDEERKRVESRLREQGPSLRGRDVESVQRQLLVEFVELIRKKRPDLDCFGCIDLPVAVKNLLRRCWNARSDLRPSAEEIFQVLDPLGNPFQT